ncbi:MAG: MBOAT family protein [Gemmatimonadota bacterium]|nr:MBOAT family protein [Gemmatimonadota bacterium]
MLFNSLHYLAFLPIVLIGYYLMSDRHRWAWLLAASCYFYAVFIPAYLLVLGGMIAVDYVAGRLIEPATGHRRRALLLMSIVANVAVLAVFKYYDFLNENLHALLASLGWSYSTRPLGLLLPVGLSFHTFQAMSYTIEVYRGTQKAERHFGIYALYVMFFPQLVAGPIERPQNMLHQFRERHAVLYRNFADGFVLIAWGMFKKVAVADRLSAYVAGVYDTGHDARALPATLATFFFAFQIYCDFSGYSDIAIGSAQLFGVRLMTNFRRPYFARSVADFWTRWHISLSTWFRDYVYIPLGGNRVDARRWVRNLLLTFLLSGLWHGANWTYVVWGLLNGVYVALSATTIEFRRRIITAIGLARVPRVHRALQVAATFTLISLTWVFFRADSATTAVRMLGNMIGSWHWVDVRAVSGGDVPLSLALIGIVIGAEACMGDAKVSDYLAERRRGVRWVAAYGICMLTLLVGVFSSQQAFIYFQF